MSDSASNMDRRGFLKSSLAATSAAFGALSFEERALLAQQAPPAAAPAAQPKDFPRGKIGNLSITRLICGGNLISGFAHSRDLIYVSKLLKTYFTDDKVHQTLQICEANGINTAILRLDGNTIRILTNYWKKNLGKIQWIAQIQINEKDFSDVKIAIDAGAVGVFCHGGVADQLVKDKKLDVMGRFFDFARKNNVTVGTAGHELAVPVAVEAAGLKPDFYMKTFNSRQYWSAQHPTKHDNVWDLEPEKTAAFMAKCERPWIAYKVLGAGAITPEEGFDYAFQNGADLICVGMFDFHVAEDVEIARDIIKSNLNRKRPWRA